MAWYVQHGSDMTERDSYIPPVLQPPPIVGTYLDALDMGRALAPRSVSAGRVEVDPPDLETRTMAVRVHASAPVSFGHWMPPDGDGAPSVVPRDDYHTLRSWPHGFAGPELDHYCKGDACRRCNPVTVATELRVTAPGAIERVSTTARVRATPAPWIVPAWLWWFCAGAALAGALGLALGAHVGRAAERASHATGAQP